MIAEIQCLPNPPGNEQGRWAHVEAAIAVIECSGLAYEVGALGTTIEGDPGAVWAVLRDAHEACLAAGASGLVTVIKVEQTGDAASQPSIAELVGKFRTLSG
jgi:uncharacterized protein YqgV (UPF0045/DUF77 family)